MPDFPCLTPPSIPLRSALPKGTGRAMLSCILHLSSRQESQPALYALIAMTEKPDLAGEKQSSVSGVRAHTLFRMNIHPHRYRKSLPFEKRQFLFLFPDIKS